MPPRYDSPEHWDAARAQEDLDFHMKHEGVGGPMPEERKPGRRGKLSFMDKEQIDFIRFATKKNIWYYRDRLLCVRGPCTLPVLRECWVKGIIDENTLIWGQGLQDYLPVKNVRTLLPQIRTPEVRLATWINKHALKRQLEKVRELRGEMRLHKSQQIDSMR